MDGSTPRRRIHCQHEVCTFLFYSGRNVLEPDVLADGDADLLALQIEAQIIGAPLNENALIVKHTIVGQFVFIEAFLDTTVSQQEDTVIDANFRTSRSTDENSRIVRTELTCK